MADGQDGGYLGRIESLGGVKGHPGKGLAVNRPDTVQVITTGETLLKYNALRKWAIIQNVGLTTANFSFDSNTGVAPTMQLLPDGILQIDDHLPWTGPVYVDAGSFTWMEASVQE